MSTMIYLGGPGRTGPNGEPAAAGTTRGSVIGCWTVGDPAGWYPDPSRDHEQRYWDGNAWSDHIADGGSAAVAPLPARSPTGVRSTRASRQTYLASDRAAAAPLPARTPTGVRSTRASRQTYLASDRAAAAPLPARTPTGVRSTRASRQTYLASERVVVEAPMSFTGSAKRIWKLTDANGWLIPVAVLLILAAWAIVAAWYLFFGLLLVPYRLIRRGGRTRKRQALQHREVLSAIERDRH